MNTLIEYLHPNQIVSKFSTLKRSMQDSNFLHWLQLIICVLFSATWFIYAEVINPLMFNEALPAMFIIMLCLLIRSLNKKIN